MKVSIAHNAKFYLAALVAFATVIVYLNALQNEFAGVWDDNAYIVENVAIRSLNAAFFRWAFLDFYASNWHPLTWLSHAVDYAFWGLNPLGHHLTSIILHATNTLLVVLLTARLLEAVKRRSGNEGTPVFLTDRTVFIAAGVSGLLFGLHPIHVESVAWVSERKDLLCALFFLLSVMAYVRYAKDQGSGSREQGSKGGSSQAGLKNGFTNKQYLLSLGFFVLALLSKPMAVTLPVVLLILDWCPLDRVRSRPALRTVLFEKIPFSALSLFSSIMTILAQRSGESIASLELTPFSTRVLVATKALIAYLGKMLAPRDLVAYYPYPREVSFFSFEYLSAALLVLGITAGCVVLARKQKLWLSAWGYYVITLIPVLGIVQVGNQAMADRYTYLPGLGPFLVAGLVVAWGAAKLDAMPRRGILAKSAGSAAALAVFFFLSYSTFQQIGIWKNSLVLWDNVIISGFESSTAYNNRGLSLDDRGQREAARADFEKAIALDPRNYFAYNNQGVLYGKDGQYERSIDYFQRAIAINPRHADSYCNLGLSYFNVHLYDLALEQYNKAIDLKQDFNAAYLNRGNLHFIMGRKVLASSDYQKACVLGNSMACNASRLLGQELHAE